MRHAFRFVFAYAILSALCFGAELDGKWTFLFDTEFGDRTLSMTLQVDGQKVSGTLEDGTAVKGAFATGLVQLTFPVSSDEPKVEGDMRITGRVTGAKIEGDYEVDEYSGSFTAKKGD